MPASSRTTFGLVDGRPVFMDLGDDSYFMLEPEEEALFLASTAKEDRFPNQHPGDVHEHAMDPPPGPVECIRPPSSVLTTSRCRSRGVWCDAARIFRLLLNVRSALHRRSIADMVSACAARPDRISRAQAAPMLAGRFARARRLVPLPGNCLTDSLALMRWLHRHDAAATLVFGVKLDPFAAHCWVQTDEILLNDHPDRVERFTPVRTVECSRHTL